MQVIATLRQKLCELFCADRAPAGYRPGATLERLRRGLGLATLEVDGLAFEINERTESQLLMHLVMTEFVLRVPTSGRGASRCTMAARSGALAFACGVARGTRRWAVNCTRACRLIALYSRH